MDIKDRVFLITGAGSGLGAAVARMVVAEGGKAVLLDVNEEAGAGLAQLGAAARFVNGRDERSRWAGGRRRRA